MTPTFAHFHITAQVKYTGPGRGPIPPGVTGNVLNVRPDSADPDALRVTVLWSDHDDVRRYSVTPERLDLWGVLPTDGAAPSAIAERLTAADDALADARSTHTTRGKSPEHLKALEALAVRLRDLSLAVAPVPCAMDDEQRAEAGEGDALNNLRLAVGVYVAAVAAVVCDAWQRETHASRGIPDAVRYDVITRALRTVDYALAVAHHTLDPEEGLVDG